MLFFAHWTDQGAITTIFCLMTVIVTLTCNKTNGRLHCRPCTGVVTIIIILLSYNDWVSLVQRLNQTKFVLESTLITDPLHFCSREKSAVCRYESYYVWWEIHARKLLFFAKCFGTIEIIACDRYGGRLGVIESIFPCENASWSWNFAELHTSIFYYKSSASRNCWSF